MLLVNNANINLKDQIGKTPLMTGIHVSMFYLIFHCYSLACNFGHHDVVKLLLNYNADINIKNNNNWSALDYGNYSIISLFRCLNFIFIVNSAS